MSIWQKLAAALEEARRLTLGKALDAMASAKARRDEASFSIALIALSAKMAKADGIVTDDEVTAFQKFFSFPEEEAKNVRAMFALAQQDVAGFEHYVSRVARIFEEDRQVLEDVLDCLYYVAMADGVAHPRELEMLDQAASGFRLSQGAHRRIKASHLGSDRDDPYLILGLEPGASAEAVKAKYRKLMRDNHPDALIARGVPSNLVAIAEGRTAAINNAYEKVLKDLA